MNLRKHTMLSSILIITALLLAACGAASQPSTSAGGQTAATAASGASTGSGANAGAVTIRYQLWDSAQKPAYEQCAQAFTKKLSRYPSSS